MLTHLKFIHVAENGSILIGFKCSSSSLLRQNYANSSSQNDSKKKNNSLPLFGQHDKEQQYRKATTETTKSNAHSICTRYAGKIMNSAPMMVLWCARISRRRDELANMQKTIWMSITACIIILFDGSMQMWVIQNPLEICVLLFLLAATMPYVFICAAQHTAYTCRRETNIHCSTEWHAWFMALWLLLKLLLLLLSFRQRNEGELNLAFSTSTSTVPCVSF